MNPDLTSLENALKALAPARLPRNLYGAIEASMTPLDETATDGSASLVASRLASVPPVTLSPEFSAQLESILSRIPHPASGKVLSFPETKAEPAKAASGWRRIAAAAAVAAFGAFSAFLIPSQSQSGAEAPVAATVHPSSPIRIHSAQGLVPASYRTGLSDATDEGIIWQEEAGPQRMLRLVYRDHVTLRDSQGREFQVERPRVRYLMVPAHID